MACILELQRFGGSDIILVNMDKVDCIEEIPLQSGSRVFFSYNPDLDKAKYIEVAEDTVEIGCLLTEMMECDCDDNDSENDEGDEASYLKGGENDN